MPTYDLKCRYGHLTEVFASDYEAGMRENSCLQCGGALVAIGSAPHTKVQPSERFYVPYLDKQKDFTGSDPQQFEKYGKNLYTAREFNQELKQQGKIVTEAGLEKDAARGAEYKRERQLKSRKEKLGELVASGKLDEPYKKALGGS